MATRKRRRKRRDTDGWSWLGVLEAGFDLVFFIPRAIMRVIMNWVD